MLKKMFDSLRYEEKSNHILLLLKNFHNTEENKIADGGLVHQPHHPLPGGAAAAAEEVDRRQQMKEMLAASSPPHHSVPGLCAGHSAGPAEGDYSEVLQLLDDPRGHLLGHSDGVCCGQSLLPLHEAANGCSCTNL